jgi:hypothetical protein
VNESRRRALMRRATGAGGSSARMLAKMQATGELWRAGELLADDARREAEAVLDAPGADTYAHGRAVTMASRILDELDREGLGRGYRWDHPELSEEDRRAWFEVDVLAEMSRALGWNITREEWQAGSGRVDRLVAEATGLLGAEDVFAAFEAWATSPGPRRVAGLHLGSGSV